MDDEYEVLEGHYYGPLFDENKERYYEVYDKYSNLIGREYPDRNLKKFFDELKEQLNAHR